MAVVKTGQFSARPGAAFPARRGAVPGTKIIDGKLHAFAMQFAHDAIIRIQQRIAFREFNYQLLARTGAEPESDPDQYCVAEMAGGDVNADVKTGAGK
jgi:hypothetical protein